MNYYNDNDEKICLWARELIRQGHAPAGTVDCRPVEQVQPAELAGYTQCHFFSGILGWPYALRLAGWPEDREVWTGSCPCQPFSAAGKRKGTADERHLWPAFLRLIAECRPATVFGEQVASRLGREWLAGVRTDLEALGYAFGAADLPACCQGAPHIRQRLFWVADSSGKRCIGEKWGGASGEEGKPGRYALQCCGTGGIPDAEGSGNSDWQKSTRGTLANINSNIGELRDTHNGRCAEEETVPRCAATSVGLSGAPGGLCDADQTGPQGRSGVPECQGKCATSQAGLGFWFPFDIIPFRDGKARRVEPGTFPLAHGVPARVVKLRGYGNAICPQAAAAFIRAYCEAPGGPA